MNGTADENLTIRTRTKERNRRTRKKIYLMFRDNGFNEDITTDKPN